MRLAYLDETRHLDAYAMGALMLTPEAAQGLELFLDLYADQLRERFSLPKKPEFHGNPINHGTDGWEALKGESHLEDRIGIFRTIVDAVAEYDGKFLVDGVSVQHHADRFSSRSMDDVAFQWVLERVNEYSKSRDDIALVVCDDGKSKADRDSVRISLSWYRNNPTPGWRPQSLDRLIDTIHFAPSHHSRLLQASDMLLYAHKSWRCARTPTGHKIWDPIWELVNRSSILVGVRIWPGNVVPDRLYP